MHVVVKPSVEQLIARAEIMIPTLRERAEQADRDRNLAPETIKDLRQAGFFRILQPERLGGYAMRPSALWEVTRHLGRGCGSTAFVVSLLGLHAWMVGMFEPRAQEEVFRGGSDAVVPNLSIGARRSNEVVVSGEGYTASGAWRYASGIDHAEWVIAAIHVPNGDTGEERIALIPQREFVVDHDSWNVIGARGTGSKTVTLTKVFVPQYRTICWSDVAHGTYPGAAIDDGPLYRLSAGSLLVLSSAAPVIALACGMIDIFIDHMKERVTHGGGKSQAHQQWVQIELGRCASEIYSAQARLIHDADEVFDWALSGHEPSLEDQARHRADAAVLARAALAAAERLSLALGGSLLPAGTPAERAFRDIHAVASHFRVQPEAACEVYGRVLLGLDPA